MMTYDETIISQYENSPRLSGLIEYFTSALATEYEVDSFYNLVWNIETAQGWGLDFWGDIVGVGRVLRVAGTSYLGFSQAFDAQPFNQAPFYAGASATENFALSDDAFRTLIYLKALANISDCTISSINYILLQLFPNRGNCYVRDNLDMTMDYVFDFELTPVEESIITQSGVLPRPQGIFATVETL